MRSVSVRNRQLPEELTMERRQRIEALHKALSRRILLLDGAMGTMIQGFGLDEDDFRGDRFRDWKQDLKGRTQPRGCKDRTGMRRYSCGEKWSAQICRRRSRSDESNHFNIP
jgi:hypothetical protein